MESSILSYPHNNLRYLILLLTPFYRGDKETQNNQVTGQSYRVRVGFPISFETEGRNSDALVRAVVLESTLL